MPKFTWRSVLIAFTLGVFASLGWATPTEVPFSELKPTKQHKKVAVLVTQVVDRHHYRDYELNDQMSRGVLERYLDTLDPNRSFFTRKDIDSFSDYAMSMDEALKFGNLEPAFEIFRLFRERVVDQVGKAETLLERNEFDFSRQEDYQFDREDSEWVADKEALQDLWRRRIKNDIIGLRLAKKDEAEIPETLRKRYDGITRRVKQFGADDVFQMFVNAFTLNIEPHTSYMSPRSSENFDISMRLSLEGIGAVLNTENEYTRIQRPILGGPAARSGQIKAGDRIVGVGQGKEGLMQDVIGWRLQDVVDLIRGPKGTLVRLNILPKSVEAGGPTREVAVVRDKIKLEDQAAKSEILQDMPGLHGKKIGVIELPAFYRDFAAQAAGERDFRSTTRDVRKLIGELKQQAIDGLVIDLRGNGGGSLIEAIDLTGLFIEEGPVVQVKDSKGHIEVEEDENDDIAYDGPLLVLVDRDSASASEIFAGAIQDYGRGLIVGEPTFGKGTVQTLVDLKRFMRGDEDMGRLRLTMAQFFRVNGDSTQHQGVIPSIIFPTAVSAQDYGERSYDNALPHSTIRSADFDGLGRIAVDALRQNHEKRILSDPAFQFLVEQERDIEELRERDTVSLVDKERRAEWEKRTNSRLERRNKLRALRGLPALTRLDDAEEDDAAQSGDGDDKDDPEGINRIMLDESAKILADLIEQGAQHKRTAVTFFD